MADQPSFIPSAWAANNSTTETIPATTTESGKASWDQGFPVETSLPLTEGGIPPKYGDFNGVLNVLSQFCLFAQAGGQFTWSSTLAYSVGAIVVGSDGSIYRAVQATTDVNPVGDTSGKWERIVSQSDIAALETDIQTAMTNAANAVANASAAQSAVSTLDANVVKLSGNQTVGGEKTFTSKITLPSGTPGIVATTTDSYVQICGGQSNQNAQGATLSINGAGQATNPGDFTLKAATSTASKELRGKPNGTLTWNGQSIINSSDERLKTAIGSVPDTVLDAWGAVQWTQFKFKDAAERKGEENCRWHAGLIAQHVQRDMQAQGVDALQYGILCHEEWQEETDEDGHLVRESGDQWMVRYTEALCMEAAYQRRRADRAEARIASLEERLAALEAFLLEAAGTAGEAELAAAEDIDDE